MDAVLAVPAEPGAGAGAAVVAGRGSGGRAGERGLLQRRAGTAQAERPGPDAPQDPGRVVAGSSGRPADKARVSCLEALLGWTLPGLGSLLTSAEGYETSREGRCWVLPREGREGCRPCLLAQTQPLGGGQHAAARRGN